MEQTYTGIMMNVSDWTSSRSAGSSDSSSSTAIHMAIVGVIHSPGPRRKSHAVIDDVHSRFSGLTRMNFRLKVDSIFRILPAD
eukprot:SAG31_NODE_1778_length_7297_cov_10.330786_3_plen_83_part_00